MEVKKINLIDWRSPNNGEERISITKLIIDNEIRVCSEFYIKEFNENLYILACNHGDKNWNYFEVSIANQRITQIDSKLLLELNPPR